MHTRTHAHTCIHTQHAAPTLAHTTAGLAVQLLFFPDSVKDDGDDAAPKPTGPQLPKVKVTSSPEDIRRAFESASGPSAPGRGLPGLGEQQGGGGAAAGEQQPQRPPE
jgi:hypothetical protein